MSGFLLGSFEVFETIASGGMGDIWRGVHIAQDIPVAIKVLRRESADDSQFKRVFRREVRAVAQLDHPGIITLFDIGEVSEVTAGASAGALEMGSPYLVMEYLERGSLDALEYPLPWSRTREILMASLDALAHAHARGITHRDLKPGNILIADRLSGSPIRLADFGIAFSYRETHPKGTEGLSVGTPTHMAPEQFLDEWRDFGPWTDLYSLGCVAYQLASGRIPFDQPDMLQLGIAHIERTPAELSCPSGYPDGFDRWVMKLLEKKPEDRFRWCADAAAALASLGKTEPPPGRRSIEVAAGTVPVAGSDWRAPAPPLRPFKLIGAGLGLFGFRTVPTVDRDAERDSIWRTFRRVREQGVLRLVVLEGSAGAGKSRLAQWLCERTHETGLAESLRVEHDRLSGRESGLSYMLANAWSCLGISAADLEERVSTVLSRAGIESKKLTKAVSELLAPAALGEDFVPGMFFEFRSRSARFSFLLKVLLGVYGERPLVLWLDDVHWGIDSLQFMRYLLARSRAEPMRIMAVLTVREDLLVESPETASLLNDLCLDDAVERTRVEPLSGSDSRVLAGSLLYLERDLAERVSEQSGGNPLYATQLVGDWVNRGILEAGAGGFVLSGSGRPEIPDDVHSVWVRRLERVLDAGLSGVDRSSKAVLQRLQMQVALELAATLGGRVDMSQWRSVCALAGISDPDPVLESLLAFRMAQPGGDAWSFSHSMLRDSVERIARERNRWASHNRLCADMLERRHPVPHWGDSERIGRFRFEAAQFDAAVVPLLRGARESHRSEEYSTALALLSLCERALDELGRPEADPLRIEALLLRGDIHSARLELDNARDLADELTTLADSPDAAGFEGAALLLSARVRQQQGRLSAALDEFAKAQQALRVTGPKHKLAECLSEQAHALLEADQLDQAWGAFNDAQEIYEEVGMLVPWAENQLGLARVSLRQGDLRHASTLCSRVSAFARREELNRVEAGAWLVLSEVRRAEGRLADADVALDNGIDLLEQVGLDRQAVQPRLLKVLLLLESGAIERAKLEAERLRNSPDMDARRGPRLLMDCIGLHIAADGPAQSFQSSFDRIAALTVDSEALAPDAVRCLRGAAERARSAGFVERAAQVESLIAGSSAHRGDGHAGGGLL